MPLPPIRIPSAVCVLVIVIVGCSPSPPPLDDDLEAPIAFAEEGESPAPRLWWKAFGDATLDSLIGVALRDNLDLREARERVREAEAVIGVERSAYFPDLQADAGVQTRIGVENFDGREDLGVGFESTLELDLFGSIRSAVEAERMRAAAAVADERAVQQAVAARVATTWYELVEARDQLALLERQVDTNESVLRLIEARFGSGQIRGVDILRQRQLVEATRERAAEEAGRVRTPEHGLSVLLGDLPGRGPDGFVELPALPPLPATGVPAELVQRRPDVVRAWLELRAADRDLATAIRRQYPRLVLSADVVTTAARPSGLFEDWIGTLAGNLFAPIFTAGRLDTEVDRATAIRAQRLAGYTRAVLGAFREVEDALAVERARSEQLRHLEQQVEWARQASAQLRRQYLNGLGGYLDVLTALTEEQELQRALLTVQRQRLASRVELYRALAGPLEES